MDDENFKIHLENPDNSAKSLCGHPSTTHYTERDVEDVDCKTCWSLIHKYFPEEN